LRDGFIEWVLPIKRIAGLAPQRFAHREIVAAKAVQALFGAVVEARDANQGVKTCDSHGQLKEQKRFMRAW
jgi:hypothetical protein